MKKPIIFSITLLLCVISHSAVELSSPPDETSRSGRMGSGSIHTTMYANRPTPLNTNSINTHDPTTPSKPPPTSPAGQTTIATKPYKSYPTNSPQFTAPSGPSSKPSSGSTIYNIQEQMQPPSANAHHYMFPTLPQSHPTQPSPTPTQQFIPAGGPYLMQILSPNGQPTGQIQYIQFLRPMLAFPPPYGTAASPSSPPPSMMPPHFGGPKFSESNPKYSMSHHGPVAQAYTQTSASIAQQYAPSAQISTTTASDGGFYPYTQQPVASFSAPVASYYHPQVYSTNRIRLVSGPGELNLNTNEYMPASSELSFAAMKPIRA